MRPLLLAVLACLAVSSRASDGQELAAPDKDVELVAKLRGRLNEIEDNAAAASPGEKARIRKALAKADEALSGVSSGKYLDLSITVNHKLKKRVDGPAVYAVPKKKPAEPAPSPRPDPATEPGACDKLASFEALSCKADEGSAKGGLGSLRSAASIYYGDAEGVYPATLDVLVPKYLEAIPELKVGGHAKTNAVRIVKNATGKSAGAYVEDTGGWLYISSPDNPALDGQIIIDCKHADYKGRPFWGF